MITNKCCIYIPLFESKLESLGVWETWIWCFFKIKKIILSCQSLFYYICGYRAHLTVNQPCQYRIPRGVGGTSMIFCMVQSPFFLNSFGFVFNKYWNFSWRILHNRTFIYLIFRKKKSPRVKTVVEDDPQIRFRKFILALHNHCEHHFASKSIKSFGFEV